MKIGLDCNSAEPGLDRLIPGLAMALAREADLQLVLFGEAASIEAALARHQLNDASACEIVPCMGEIGMADRPTDALRADRPSSMKLGLQWLQESRIDAFVSAGNSGALLALATAILGTSPGCDRPAFAAIIPTQDGKFILIDAGANADNKPAHLVQFAALGRAFASAYLGLENPRVGLLSNGSEDGKGNRITKETFALLEPLRTQVHFAGNIEGCDLFAGKADVVVCEGFVGNAVLKCIEAVAEFFQKKLSETPEGPGLWQKLFAQFEYALVGGAPLLGVGRPCIAAHGRSSAAAIAQALIMAKNLAKMPIALSFQPIPASRIA